MHYEYQLIECNKDNQIVPNGECFGFATIDDFRIGIQNLAKKGWKFGGLHPWHMTPIDTVYIYRD